MRILHRSLGVRLFDTYRTWEGGEMKKFFTATLLSAVVVTFGMISGTSAQAVSCSSFNKGTATAFHSAGARGEGLYMIADQCHAG
jgi:hypothetical protein